MRIAGVRLCEKAGVEEFNAKALQLKLGDKVLVEKNNAIFSGVVAEDVKVADKDPKITPQVIRKIYDFETGGRFAYYPIENEGLDFCKARVKDLKITMKLLKVKFLPPENKLIFFYSAEERVDFRELVKVLAGRFHLRIEMRQINIRDECRLLGGIGVCGRVCCCNSAGQESNHATSKTTKLQCQNAGKLIGYCGRLLCCLAFDPLTPGEDICKGEKETNKVFYKSSFDSLNDNPNPQSE